MPGGTRHDAGRTNAVTRMVSPDVIRTDVNATRRVMAELDALARVVLESYEAAYEASFSTTNNADGIPPGKHGFRVSDPTGDVATSGMHKRMRWRVRQATRVLRRLRPILEEAEDILLEAFNETDPEMREKLRRLRELEAAAVWMEITG
jgi:hypothetical protein